MRIKSFGMKRLPLGLYCSHHADTNALIAEIGAEVLHIEELAAEYDRLVELLGSIVKRATAYVSTSLLGEADRKRDNALGIILNIITAHLTNQVEDRLAAAQVLDVLVAPFRKIRNHGKGAETREVALLLELFDTEEARAHIATLSLDREVEMLRLRNSQMDSLLTEKVMEEVERMPQKSINTAELRKQVDEQYARIVQAVNAYAIVHPSEEIADFITRMNALISLNRGSDK